LKLRSASKLTGSAPKTGSRIRRRKRRGRRNKKAKKEGKWKRGIKEGKSNTAFPAPWSRIKLEQPCWTPPWVDKICFFFCLFSEFKYAWFSRTESCMANTSQDCMK
jgi:hypothetical protein